MVLDQSKPSAQSSSLELQATETTQEDNLSLNDDKELFEEVNEKEASETEAIEKDKVESMIERPVREHASMDHELKRQHSKSLPNLNDVSTTEPLSNDSLTLLNNFGLPDIVLTNPCDEEKDIWIHNSHRDPSDSAPQEYPQSTSSSGGSSSSSNNNIHSYLEEQRVVLEGKVGEKKLLRFVHSQ